MKLSKTIAAIFFAILFCLSPLVWQNFFISRASSLEEIEQDTVWDENKTIEDVTVVAAGKVLTIEKGVEITFEKGASLILDKGLLLVKGTKKEPVKFKGKDDSGAYSVGILSGGGADIRNAEIENGGTMAVPIGKNQQLVASVFAAEYVGAFAVYGGGWLQAEGCNFHDNVVAVSMKEAYGDRVKINRSSFSDNNKYDVFNESSPSKGAANLKYNWWGSSTGPEETTQGNSTYKKISGNVDVGDWSKNEGLKDPVILIPGILGSQKKRWPVAT